MKNLLFLVVLLTLLFNVGVVSADSNPCDSICVEEVLQRKLSVSKIQDIGYGNVVRALTSHLNGNLQGALYLAGLGNSIFAANANANVIYGTKLDGTIQGLVLCGPEDSFSCSEGAIWGYKQVNQEHYVIQICTTEGCR